MPIDKEARAMLVECTRRLYETEITDIDYASQVLTFMRGRKGIISRRRVSWAELTDDPLIYKVYVWAFTQGLSVAPVKLEGEYAPSPEDADTFERILLFLESGLEYEWPPEPGDRELGVWQHLRWAVTNVFTGGALYRREMCAYWSAGDKHAWPFLRMEDYEAELRKKRPAP